MLVAAGRHAGLVGEGADDLGEHPHSRRRRSERARRAWRSSKTPCSSSCAPSERPRTRTAFCKAGRMVATTWRAAVASWARLGAAPAAEIALEGAAHLEAEVGGDAAEGALDLEQAVTLGEERLVARLHLASRDAEDGALVALGQDGAGALAKMHREGARVGANDREEQVHRAAVVSRLGVVGVRREQLEVAEHAEEREKAERHQAAGVLAGDLAHQVEDLRVVDASRTRDGTRGPPAG